MKPCPFCNSVDVGVKEDVAPVVECYCCGARGPTRYCGVRNITGDCGISAWEDQMTVDNLEEQVEDLSGTIAELTAKKRKRR